MSDNEKKTSDKFANFLSKASDVGKKAAVGIQKGAHVVSEQTKKTIHEQKMKKLKPLFLEEYQSEEFNIPNIIKVVDDADRREIEICEGAIGYRGKENNVEILYLYDEFIPNCGIQFVPTYAFGATYYVDNFDRSRFIQVDCIFNKAQEEKLAELENIAYSLGAKTCSIEIAYSQNVSSSTYKSTDMQLKSGESGFKSSSRINGSSGGGKTVVKFAGSNQPVRPKLKWFIHDDNIKNLIEMRCSGANAIQSKVLQLSGATSATMSQEASVAIDIITKKVKGKAGMSFAQQSKKETSSTLIYEIEF